MKKFREFLKDIITSLLIDIYFILLLIAGILYYDYNKMSSSEDLNNPLSKKYGNENPSSSQYKRYNPNER